MLSRFCSALISIFAFTAPLHAQGNDSDAGLQSQPAESAPAADAMSSGTKFSCTMSQMTRTVEVGYDAAGSKVPCKVNYTKDTEAPGATQVLYSAAAEEGYCERKATEFVEKLKSNGWTCSAQ
jgi:hypothetical protein